MNQLTVKELIEQLQTLPEDAKICYHGDEYGHYPVYRASLKEGNDGKDYVLIK